MSSFLEQTTKLIQSLSPKQRILILAIALAAGVGIQQFVHWQKERGFKPIYSGLGAEDAGQVLQKLKELGVEYRLSAEGGAILVPEERVAELRLEMANSGLPKSGHIGFELFDKTTFGATDFAEHVNFRRAVEGELERSVMSINEVEQARVHVTFAKDSIYSEARQPAKASVLVKLRAGSTLSAQSVLAVTHLVSSAVEGLSPDQVSVLDMRGKLLSRPKRPGLAGVEEVSDATIEHQQRIEKDVLQKIQLTLGPLLGEDKFRAAVSVECEMNSGEQSEESYDPTKSVMLTSQSSIDSVGSNAPPAQAGAGTNSSAPPAAAPRSGTATTRKTENVTFQTSRTVRRLTLPQGAIKTLSISVLLDQGVNWEKTPGGMRKVFVPPSPDTVKVIRDLVAGVSGLKKERGDQLVVESLPFESTVNAEPPSKADMTSGAGAPPGILIDGKPLEQFARDPKILAIAGATTLGLIAVIAMFVMRSRKRKLRAKAALAAKALASGAGSKNVNRADEGGLASALTAGEEGNALLPEDIARREVMLETIRQEVRANPAMFAGVVQEWLLNTGAK